jgi:hypothetical protein
MDLDVAGSHLGIAVFTAIHHFPADKHYRFRRDLGDELHHGRRRPIRTERALNHPVAVAQVEEDEPPEIAASVDPTAEPYSRADVVRAECAAAVRAHRSGGHSSLRLEDRGVARNGADYLSIPAAGRARRWMPGTGVARLGSDIDESGYRFRDRQFVSLRNHQVAQVMMLIEHNDHR